MTAPATRNGPEGNLEGTSTTVQCLSYADDAGDGEGGIDGGDELGPTEPGQSHAEETGEAGVAVADPPGIHKPCEREEAAADRKPSSGAGRCRPVPSGDRCWGECDRNHGVRGVHQGVRQPVGVPVDDAEQGPY